MITLYHGSNIEIDVIDLSKGLKDKDFGIAFQLERFHEKLIDDETLARELTYKKLNRQYYFGTEKAISKLKKL